MPAAASSGVVVMRFSGPRGFVGGCLTPSYEQNFWPLA
jgi:hypothetical protein